MSQALRLASTPMSIAEFEAFTEAFPDTDDLQLIDGELLALTNPSVPHAMIVRNIGLRLSSALDGHGCTTFFGGVAVQLDHDNRKSTKLVPDLLVHCGPPTTENYVVDPTIVVEVLPPSTRDFDRGSKLDFYKSLPPVRHILLVDQRQIRIEHHHRSTLGWTLDILTEPDERIVFDEPRFELRAGEIYAGVPGIAA